MARDRTYPATEEGLKMANQAQDQAACEVRSHPKNQIEHLEMQLEKARAEIRERDAELLMLYRRLDRNQGY